MFQPSQVCQDSGSVFSFRVDANAFFLPLCREALPVAYLLIQAFMSVTHLLPPQHGSWHGPTCDEYIRTSTERGAMSETVTPAMYREEFGPTGKGLGLVNSGYRPQGDTRISQGQQRLLVQRPVWWERCSCRHTGMAPPAKTWCGLQMPWFSLIFRDAKKRTSVHFRHKQGHSCECCPGCI